MVPFKCDYCIFVKVTGRLVKENNDPTDEYLMVCIRRVILDAFWSRTRSTVASSTRLFREMMVLAASLGFDPPFESPGPLSSFDHCGYTVAILMVTKSTRPGWHSESQHVQWDTMRKYRSAISNQSRASRVSNFTSWSTTDYKGTGYKRLTSESCGSLWFHRFSAGCRRQMGQDWRPNRALSNPLMIKLLTLLVKDRIRSSADLG